MTKYAHQLKQKDPEGVLTHIHVPNRKANLMGVEIKLNSLGMRAKEIKPKKVNEIRTLVLGDSVTLGGGVAAKDVYSSLTENRLNNENKRFYNFLNSGVGNYNLDSQIELLKRQLDNTQPDIVLLNYFINDIEEQSKPFFGNILGKTMLFPLLYEKLSSLNFNRTDNLDSYYANLYSSKTNLWSKTLSKIIKTKKDLNKRKIQ